MAASSCPSSASQTLTPRRRPSPPAVARRWPSGCQVMEKTTVAGEPARRDIPDFHAWPVARRGDPPAVGRVDRHVPDFMGVPGEGPGLLALAAPQRGRVPNADGAVLAGRGEAPAVGAERQAAA